MEYNKKEQLLDKIKGLNLVNPDEYGDKYNKGVRHSLARTVAFFNKELVPEVPQYVADWYEENKDNLDYNLWNFIMDWDEQEPSEFKQWVDESNKSFLTIANMHQFGYKVEKEKHYKIKIIKTGQYLYKNGKDLFFSSYSRPEYNPRLVFTKEELKQENSDWVFDCPGIEIEEVEE